MPDYPPSNRIFVGRFEKKTSKAGNEYMCFSLSPEDFEKLQGAKNDKGWATLMVGKSQKTDLPYFSYTPFTPKIKEIPNDGVFTSSPRVDMEANRPDIADIPF